MSSPTRRRHHVHKPQEKYDDTRVEHNLDIRLFAPELLRTEHGLQNALVVLDKSWWDDEPLELTVKELMAGPPNLFEYIVAIALDEHRYHQLVFTLRRTFPTSASIFFTSLAAALVARLHMFYACLISSDVPRGLNACHRSVPLALKALHALNELKLGAEPETPMSKKHPDEIDGIRCKQPQRKVKHAKRQSRIDFSTDSAPFDAIGKNVPRTREEANELTRLILVDQNSVLEEYLRVLKIPELASTIEDLYIVAESPAASTYVAPSTSVSRLNAPPQGPFLSHGGHPAFPKIQPLKAAKYYAEPADGFGPWNLLISSRAIQHLKSHHRDQATWSMIKKKMQELSDGFFSESNQKRLSGNDQGIPVYEAKLSRDLRIVYQIDIAPDDATLNDQQVIKVWGIHTHAQMDKRLWTSISHHQTSIGGEYRRRCLHRETPKFPGRTVIFPCSWPTAIPKLPVEAVGDVSMNAEEQLELHSKFALEKFTRMSQALLNSILSDQDAAYPFELTGPEREICDHPSSCFVLGRSGTGKTTTMVTKMIAREMLRIQQAAEHSDANALTNCRQLFVTQSRILAGRVQEYFGKMMMSHSAGYKSSQELQRLTQRGGCIRDGEDMLDADDEDERADLPKKFSDLEDHHFPLFLTMDQLCKLLEADCNLSFKRHPRTQEHRRAEQKSQSTQADKEMMLDDDNLAKDDGILTASSSQDKHTVKASIITFDVFLYAYWPHFPQTLTKRLDPALVYNEFLGVIKGSEESLETNNGTTCLDKQTYLTFSNRRQSTFSKHRNEVYELFECYNKLKGARGDYDAADRTHAILRALHGTIPGGRKVEYLYVDEAQDNLIIDACLLRFLCSNVHGLFFAGDTAQTISMGSSFRFDDLKSFLYRIEEQSCGSRPPVHPESFQLDINYRSHAGVVDCAHSVVELITKFWPNSIDALARERGVVVGPRPVFFWGWDPEVARYEQFLFHESGHIEFGAQQCILVRNDKAREDLRHRIGDTALVMTLYESKGLEFNDVLLFNFFSDSTATLAEWRVILNAIDGANRGHIPTPQFDETRHSSICSELKSLYVGITRARNHVWILENSDRGDPMRVFWESRGLIQTCRPGDQVPELAVHSTPEQWAQQGHSLFKTKHFQQSMFCFERAGLRLERSVACAHLHRRAAHRIALQREPGPLKDEAYLQAAEYFVICAGLCSSLTGKRSHFTSAAESFVVAGEYQASAQAYLGAEKFTQAAQQFRRAGSFDELVDVVLLHPGEVDATVAEQFLSVAKLHFHKEDQLEKAARLFKSVDEHLLYLEDVGFQDAHTKILERLGRWSDAAELHYAEGQHLQAITLWLRAGDPESKRRAGSCLLDSLWRILPLGGQPDESNPFENKLLELLRTLGVDLPEQAQRDESAMFTAILEADRTRLLHMAREFDCRPRPNPLVALLCFDHSLTKPPQMYNDSAQTVSRHLEDYDSYARLMRKVIFDWQNAQTLRLLGLIERHESVTGASEDLHVLPTSVLSGHFKNRGADGHDSNESFAVDLRRLPSVISQVLGQRMKDRLRAEHDVCIRVKAFRPCLNFAVAGQCGRPNCYHEHLSREALDIHAFNLRIRLHMQQILIVHKMDLHMDNEDRNWRQRIWQERLYDSLLPTFYALGHISGIVQASIPEHHRALQVLSDGLRDRFYSLKPYRDGPVDRFLTNIVQTTMLAYSLDRTNAAHYTWRADCVVLNRPPLLQRAEGYLVHDILHFLQATSASSVANGVLFIKHVLDKRIPIDIHTLLNVLEAVIGRAIVAARRSLHQLTLPRSWIVNILSSWDERCNISNATIVRILFQPLGDLLEGIYTNQDVDHLTYDRHPLSDLPLKAISRSVLMFRICKCLTLFGYNIFNEHLRANIGKTLASINRSDRTFPPLVVQYVKADRWANLAHAIRASTDSPLDEMVLLCKSNKIPNLYYPPRGIKLVRFNSESDILPSLAYAKTSELNPEAKPFVPNTDAQRAATPLPDAEGFEAESAVDESFNDETKHVEVASNNFSVQRTAAEVDAVVLIQTWCRRWLAMGAMSRAGTGEARSRIHADCQAEVGKLEASSVYRCIFLGPLPHALTALQACGRAVAKTKKAASKRITSLGKVDLEKENDLITKCNILKKKHIPLLKDLEPTSKLHNEGSLDKLRQRVQEVNDLFQDTLTVAPEIRKYVWDMELGYKGIVRVAPPPRQMPKTQKKPSLNTEDIDF